MNQTFLVQGRRGCKFGAWAAELLLPLFLYFGVVSVHHIVASVALRLACACGSTLCAGLTARLLARTPAGDVKRVMRGVSTTEAVAAFARLWVSDEHWTAADKVMTP